MKYLKIQNNGELDIRLVALMGGTTKSNDKYKIGQFGTGLKYTLAYLYRNNIDFKIFSGVNEIQIGLEVEDINGNEFEIICINGNRTSITTQMGQQWSAWMILRELWCNALDEGGAIKTVVSETDMLTTEENKTYFFIQVTAEIQLVLDEWKNYFIQDREPISDNSEYALYTNSHDGKLKLYKHGVLIYSHPDYKSLFVYDIKGADINELREFKGYVSHDVYKTLESPSREAVSYFLNNITDQHYEGVEMDYDWFSRFGDVWREAIGDNKIGQYGDRGYYSDSGVNVDFSNVIELPKKLYAALVKDFEGVGAMAVTDDETEFYETNNSTLKEKIFDCLDLLKVAGYQVSEEIIFRYGLFRDKQKTASSNRNKKTIMISEVCKDFNSVDLAKIIIEYNEFIITGFEKKSFKFSRHIIALYASKLL